MGVTVGDAQVCIDFRLGNKRSKDPVYFVPRVKDVLWQFVWNVLFFGVKGAVTHFQRVMEQVLSGLPDHIVVVIYVDNILVASDDVESHVKHVEAVVKKLNVFYSGIY